MMAAASVIGRSPDTLTIEERRELTGKWIALEFYSPATLPLREIAAIGDTAAECANAIAAEGRDPANFEYIPIRPAF